MTGLLHRLAARGVAPAGSRTPQQLSAPVQPYFAALQDGDGPVDAAPETSHSTLPETGDAPYAPPPEPSRDSGSPKEHAGESARPPGLQATLPDALPEALPQVQSAFEQGPAPDTATGSSTPIAGPARDADNRRNTTGPAILTETGASPVAQDHVPTDPELPDRKQAETATGGDKMQITVPQVDGPPAPQTAAEAPAQRAAFASAPGDFVPIDPPSAPASEGSTFERAHPPGDSGPALSIGRIDVIFEAPATQAPATQAPARQRAEPQRTRGFEGYDRARLGQRR